VLVTYTRTIVVDVPAEEAEHLKDPYDYTDVLEAADRYKRQTHHGHEYDFEGGVTIEAADEEALESCMWPPEVLQSQPDGGYIWSARHFVGQARHELGLGRYREGHCPDLDVLNVELGRLGERLRVMALAIDGIHEQAAS
jgi:hypothetical protein